MKHEQIVEVIGQATKDVFRTMLDLDLDAGEPYIERPITEPFDGVISTIGMAGTSWVGTGSISCSARAACRLSSALLMEEMPEIDDQVMDAVGELTNVVIGNVKGKVEQHLGLMSLSVPLVVLGSRITAHAMGHESVLTVVPFTFGDDWIDVKVCLVQRERRDT